MRILKLLISLTLLFTLISGAMFLIGREVLLTLAVMRLEHTLVSLENMSKELNLPSLHCKSFASTGSLNPELRSAELAFTSDTQYQLQALCDGFGYQPVVVQKDQLPPLVKKMPGSGGFVWSNETPTSVTLGLWGRYRTLTLELKKTSVAFAPAQSTSDLRPRTTCEGFGSTCCELESEAGVGELNATVTNCPKSCYDSCEARPVVLSLNTQPFYDSTTRMLSVSSNSEVIFNYVVSPGGVPLQEVVLDFGDGQQGRSASTSGALSHRYQCAQASCTYTAGLKVTNTKGISNLSNKVNQVTVQVTAN